MSPGRAFTQSFDSVPFRELVIDPAKSLPGPDGPSLDDNLVVHGDNLEALKALLPRYAGEVDVIYIDPPYNTGKEGWAYNDRVSSPQLTRWLGKVVDRDDLERHDKWLCMIWPRLQLLRELLSDTGVLFVSVDDNEQAHLHTILDEVFGEENWLGTLVWKNATDNNPTHIAVEHEYIIAFARLKDRQPRFWSGTESASKSVMMATYEQIKREQSDLEGVRTAFVKFVSANKSAFGDLARYKEVDARGPYVARRNLENPGKPGYSYDIIHPTSGKPCTRPLWGWRHPEASMRELLAEDRIVFGESETKIPELKAYLAEVEFPLRSVISLDSRKGANDLERIFGSRDIFRNPKPVELIDLLLEYTAKTNAVVLDSFAGSGTTAHAVLEANRRDGGNRRFVLVEVEDYADRLTAERIRRVAQGKTKEPSDGTGGSFTFCSLGDSLDLDRFFEGETRPNWEQVARYVVFTATGTTISQLPAEPPLDWFVGEAGGYRIHLLYKPDIAFMRSADAAVSAALADSIAKANAGGRPVLLYAAAAFVSQRELSRREITFCQLPYAIHRLLGDSPPGSNR